jgi:acyl-CoA dehydrogenase
MSLLTLAICCAVLAVVLAYYRVPLLLDAIALGLLLLLYLLLGAGSVLAVLLLLLATAGLAVLSVERIRKTYITPAMLRWYRSCLPRISATEQEAIDAGTVWWEGQLFSGRPDWRQLLAAGDVALSEKEQAFLDGPAEELCRRVDSWAVNFRQADIPADVVRFIKKHGFLGMTIPREYGGLGFSPLAQVAVLTKLFSLSSVVTNFINIPNALGPGELLLKYGTQEQKDHYLPRLASGEEVPCFALTSTLAGSDATSLPDTGTVCRGTWQGEEIIGMRLDMDKRYITLAPVATLIGLAFRLRDPDHLLGEVDDYGITCALLPADLEGLEIGRRHYPIGAPFLNGPIRARGVFVPLDSIIGGPAMAGKGWGMLLNCLAAGRAVSLPSLSLSLAKNALASSGAYVRIRRQFNLPIARFEGVQQPLAAMAGLTYIIQAATIQTAKALCQGEKPAVAGSILKYHCTEMAREVINHAMDIHGGKAVMKGPANYLSDGYESAPVAITVEGANIMTRSLMIFGQGAVRCHPYLLREMQLAAGGDKKVLEEFDQVLFEHLGATACNTAHALVHALTGSLWPAAPVADRTARFYRYAFRLSAAFAVIADVAMLSLRDSLKMREMMSARLGDLLSMLYLTSMVLKQHHDQDRPEEDLPVVEWACCYLLHRYQEAMHEILLNLPNRVTARLCRWLIFPLGRRFHKPVDALDRQIAGLVSRATGTRQRLIDGVYLTPEKNNPIGGLNDLLPEVDQADFLYRRLQQAVKQGRIAATTGPAVVDQAEAAGVLDAEEAQALRNYEEKILAYISVDEFDYHDLARAARRKTTTRKKTGTRRARKPAARKKPGSDQP